MVAVAFAASNLGRGTCSVAKFDIGIPDKCVVNYARSRGIEFGARWQPDDALKLTVGGIVSIFCSRQRKNPSEQRVEWQAVIYNGNEAPAYPIWPTAGRVVVGELELRVENSPGLTATFFWLPWRVLAEGMPEIRGVVRLVCQSGYMRVDNDEIDEVSWWGESEDERKFEELKQRFQIC